MKNKNKIYYVSIYVVVAICCIGIIGSIVSYNLGYDNAKDNVWDLISKYDCTLKKQQINHSVLIMDKPRFIDYSQEAYVKISPKKDTRFIWLECINSTLVINEGRIYCQG